MGVLAELVLLEELLRDLYADFEMLNGIEMTSYVLGSELWEKNFFRNVSTLSLQLIHKSSSIPV